MNAQMNHIVFKYKTKTPIGIKKNCIWCAKCMRQILICDRKIKCICKNLTIIWTANSTFYYKFANLHAMNWLWLSSDRYSRFIWIILKLFTNNNEIQILLYVSHSTNYYGYVQGCNNRQCIVINHFIYQMNQLPKNSKK